MKKYFLISVLLLLASSLQAQDLQSELTSLSNAWEVAFENGDATALAATYAEEVELVQEDGSVQTATQEQIEARWAKNFATLRGSLELGSDQIFTPLDNGRARAQGSFTQTMTNIETGESTTFEGYYDHQVVQVDG
ncbi:MAG: hypothetical protein AAF804_14050, partial [Bacteroidota bacterium]